MKRFVPIVLIIAMLLSACGESGTGSSWSNAANSAEPTPTPAPKFNMSAKFLPLDNEMSFTARLFTDEGIYATAMEKTGEEIPDDVIKEAEEKGEEAENDGRYDVYELSLYFISYDGKIKKLSRYVPLEPTSDDENKKSFTSVSNVCAMAEGGDGKLISLENIYASYSSAPDDESEWETGKDYREFENRWYLRTIDTNTGKVLSSSEIINEDGASFEGNTIIYKDGKVFCISLSSIGYGVTGIGLGGIIDKTALYVGEISDIMLLQSGEIGVFGQKDGKLFLSSLDTESYVLTDLYELSGETENVYSGRDNYEFFYSTKSELRGFDKNLSADDRLFTWSSVNVNPERITSDIAARDDGFVFVENEYEKKSCESTVVILTKSEYDENLDRTVINLYSKEKSSSLVETLTKFNKNSTETRIELCTDVSDADIIDLSGFDIRELADSDILEDLYPYIDADSEINREDYFENVLSACEIDGKLYSTVAGFSVNTVIGRASVVGQKPGWNYEEYYSALEKSGCDAFDVYVTREDIFKETLSQDLDWYMDYENGYCNFDNENFAKMLEFVKSFPETFDSATYEWDETYDNSDIRLNEGRQMLLRTTVYTFDEACKAGFEFEDDITFIGYPTQNGTGNSLNIYTLSSGENFAMSAASPRKTEAWEFLRYFMTEEYQKTTVFFPVSKAVFSSRLKDYDLDYLIDDDGNLMYDKKTGEKRKRALGSMYLSNFKQIYYYGFDDNEKTKFIEFINSTCKISESNDKVYKIISSAAEGYFDGSITSDEAAALVQEKVTEYLNVSIYKN